MTSIQPQAVSMYFWSQNKSGSGEKGIILQDSRKPFRCGLCSVPFSVCKELVVHVKAHFVNKPYLCGFCDVSFTSSFDLLVHVKSHNRLVASSDTATSTNSVGSQEKNTIVIGQQCPEKTNHDFTAGWKGMKRGTLNTFYENEVVSTISINDLAVDSAGLSDSAGQKLSVMCGCDDGEDDCRENLSLKKGGSDELSAAVPMKQEILENQNRSHETIDCSAELLTECLQRPQSTIQRCLENQSQIVVTDVCKCGECDTLFSSTSDLTLHWKYSHSACSVCGESFPDPLLLQYHLTKFAHGKRKTNFSPCRPFLCELCGADFLLSRHIQAHIKSFHEIQCEKPPSSRRSTDLCNGNQKVEDCPNDSSTHAVNIRDILVSVGNSTYDILKKHKCPICSESVSSSELETHVNNVHMLDGHFKCPVCEKSFKKWRGLRNHHKIYHANPNKMFPCPHCNKIFRASYNLKVHVDQVHNPDYRPYECKECGKTFKRHHHLRDHTEARHSSLKPYICPKCERPHKSRKSLRSHLKFCNPTGKSSACSSQKKTPTKTRVRSVKCMKSKQEYYGDMCHLCGKVVKGLGRHLAIVHSDEKPHKCSLCDRAYKTKSMLQIHTRTHTKEKPFVCEICGKSFALKNTLQYHKNSHTNARPYLCQFCGAGFNNHPALMTHRRGHTGDKRYQCELCDFKFVTKSRLQRHALTHTDIRPWSCDNCGKTYRSRSTLRYHERHSHKKSI